MGFSADLMPLAGPLPDSPGLYVAGGYSGVGNVRDTPAAASRPT